MLGGSRGGRIASPLVAKSASLGERATGGTGRVLGRRPSLTARQLCHQNSFPPALQLFPLSHPPDRHLPHPTKK
ncbi:hypothetical protein J1614_005406 [Plenodomus biglobosus]|nr:hypothetical protein J1614_005406 [Plenodomus biglobosus]